MAAPFARPCGFPDTVVLVSFYNTQAPGLRLLQALLERAGYQVSLFFYENKGFHPPSAWELQTLTDRIQRAYPIMVVVCLETQVGFSAAQLLFQGLKPYGLPVVCGGAYATVYPMACLSAGAHYVLQGNDARALVFLADALTGRGEDPARIPGLSYRDGAVFVLKEAVFSRGLEHLPPPCLQSSCVYRIQSDTIKQEDPERSARSYTVFLSRDCPYQCAGCAQPMLRQMAQGKSPVLHFRSVQSVLWELNQAKKFRPYLCQVQFIAPCFPEVTGWLEEFLQEYPQTVGLPFWLHTYPKNCDTDLLRRLRKAGLRGVHFCLGSGSLPIRRQILYRYETNRELLRTACNAWESGVDAIAYTFFQIPDQPVSALKETFSLLQTFPGRYSVSWKQFVPALGYSPPPVPDCRVPHPVPSSPPPQDVPSDPVRQAWQDLIALWQVPLLRPVCHWAAENPTTHGLFLHRLWRLTSVALKFRDQWCHIRLLLRRFFSLR